MSSAPGLVTLRVRRTTGQGGPVWVDYRVPLAEKMTVLDAVTQVQRSEAPDLAYRYACRVGMCGTCAMVINGRERWACRTLVTSLGTRLVTGSAAQDGLVVTVEPLRNLPVIKDLAVDMAPFFGAMKRAGAHFEPDVGPSQSGTIQPDGSDWANIAAALQARDRIDPHIECITCGACYSACTMVSWDPEYLGPAALNRAATLVDDRRDRAREERLAVVGGEHGCWRCHSQFTCTEVCPMQLRPTESIGRLKRQLVGRAVGGLVGLKRPTEATTTTRVAREGADQTGEDGAGTRAGRAKGTWWRQLRAAAAAAFVAATLAYAYQAGAGATPIDERTRTFFPASPGGDPPPPMLAGATLFETAGCERCHAVLGQGGREGPDLWRAGERHSRQELRQLIQDPDRVLGPGVMPPYRPTAGKDLDRLVDYVAALDFSRRPAVRFDRTWVRGGGTLYLQGCLDCHGGTAAEPAPSFVGLREDRSPRAVGSRDELRDLLSSPSFHASYGVDRDTLAFADLDDLIAYLSPRDSPRP